MKTIKTVEKKEIFERIDTLRNAYAYSLEHRLLSDAKRASLNLERVAWLQVVDALEKGEPDNMPEPHYRISPALEREVAVIIQKINDTRWGKKQDKSWN